LSGIDLLLAKSLSSKIKKKLEPKIEQKLKLQLFKKYGLSIKQSIEDFSKFNDILIEFLKSDSQKFETECLFEIISVDNFSGDSVIILIKDNSLVEQFLEAFGDKESRRIIEQVLKKPLLISEVLEICKLSKTSGYRKINSLIRNGFLIKTSHEMTNKNREISRYSMFYKKVNMEMENGRYIIKVKILKNIFENSTVIQTIMN
jgi:predicted transcriptional regulator